MPEPPAAVFDLDGVDQGILPANEPSTAGDTKYVLGAPGTVPARATVRITNLDRQTATVATTATPDGSFLAVAVATAGEELRFEWARDGLRSAPADGVVLEKDVGARTIGVRPSPRFDCVVLSPGYALDFSSEGARALAIQNDCDAPITLASPRARLGLPDFGASLPSPLEVAAGGQSELSFEFSPTGEGDREDVWFVDVTLEAETLRYPVTLRAE